MVFGLNDGFCEVVFFNLAYHRFYSLDLNDSTHSIRQAETGSTKTILYRVTDQFDLHPERLIADIVYASGVTLDWMVKFKVAPHIPVIDKAGRTNGTWSRADFE